VLADLYDLAAAAGSGEAATIEATEEEGAA
jgi:hypothetical protein